MLAGLSVSQDVMLSVAAEIAWSSVELHLAINGTGNETCTVSVCQTHPPLEFSRSLKKLCEWSQIAFKYQLPPCLFAWIYLCR
ncbi:hypothetical protein PMI18_05775 [Pseudomonas sp. GM102]|nr:hypothetical protein PMI18_05775 [Pseudomonas sp. GM102]